MPLRSLLALILPLFLITACGTRNPYHVMDRMSREDTIPLKAMVTDLEDLRPHEQFYNQSYTMIPIFGLWGGYMLDRHDSVHSSATSPFPEMTARLLAERLSDADVFNEVNYVAPGELPAPGAYDVVVRGRIHKMQVRGAITRYGLSILGDLFWELGVPNRSRRWIIDVEYWLQDAYTGEPITEPIQAELTTSRHIYTRYANTGRVDDLQRKMVPALDAFIAGLWEKAPAGNDPYWAELRSDGQELLAQRAREEERLRRGTPPTFSFLSPASDSILREPRIELRWSATAPEKVRSIALVVNNQPVELGVDMLSLANEDTAPVSLPARNLSVPLRMGENTLQALVADHRGNETRAELSLTRLPAELTPARRYALLVGDAATDVQTSIRGLQEALEDPYIGQFQPEHIMTMTGQDLVEEELRPVIQTFGRQPVAGDLVFIYLGATGDWPSLEVAGSGMTLDEIIDEMQRSIASSNVVFLEDIDWAGGPGNEQIERRLTSLPPQWAYLSPQITGGPRAGGQNGHTLLGQVATEVLRGSPDATGSLTLEQFLDRLLDGLEAAGRTAVNPDKYGYYSPNLTMAERD